MFGVLVFLEKAYNDSLQQFLTRSRVKTKFFCHFLKYGSLVFLEIVYNDSLQQYIISTSGKIHEKKIWGPNLGQNQA